MSVRATSHNELFDEYFSDQKDWLIIEASIAADKKEVRLIHSIFETLINDIEGPAIPIKRANFYINISALSVIRYTFAKKQELHRYLRILVDYMKPNYKKYYYLLIHIIANLSGDVYLADNDFLTVLNLVKINPTQEILMAVHRLILAELVSRHRLYLLEGVITNRNLFSKIDTRLSKFLNSCIAIQSDDESVDYVPLYCYLTSDSPYYDFLDATRSFVIFRNKYGDEAYKDQQHLRAIETIVNTVANDLVNPTTSFSSMISITKFIFSLPMFIRAYPISEKRKYIKLINTALKMFTRYKNLYFRDFLYSISLYFTTIIDHENDAEPENIFSLIKNESSSFFQRLVISMSAIYTVISAVDFKQYTPSYQNLVALNMVFRLLYFAPSNLARQIRLEHLKTAVEDIKEKHTSYQLGMSDLTKKTHDAISGPILPMCMSVYLMLIPMSPDINDILQNQSEQTSFCVFLAMKNFNLFTKFMLIDRICSFASENSSWSSIFVNAMKLEHDNETVSSKVEMELQNQINIERSKYHELSLQINQQSNEDIDAIIQERDDLLNKLEKLEVELLNHKQEIERVNSENSSKQDEITKIKSENTALNTSIASERSIISELRSNNNDLLSKNNDLIQENMQLKFKIDRQKILLQTLVNTVKSTVSAIDEL